VIDYNALERDTLAELLRRYPDLSVTTCGRLASEYAYGGHASRRADGSIRLSWDETKTEAPTPPPSPTTAPSVDYSSMSEAARVNAARGLEASYAAAIAGSKQLYMPVEGKRDPAAQAILDGRGRPPGDTK
jgi:hypothetical protein